MMRIIVPLFMIFVVSASGYSQKNVSFYQKRAQDFMKTKSYDKAILALDTAIFIASDSCYLYILRGQSKNAIKQYDKAILDFTKSINLCPKRYSGSPYYYRGVSRNRMEDYTNAIVDFDSYFSIGSRESEYNHVSGDDQVFFESSKANYMVGNYKKALNQINKCLEFDQFESWFANFIHTHKDEVYFLKGCILLKMERYADAIKSFDIAIRLSKNKLEYYQERGKAKLLNNQYSHSILDFNEALRLSPKYSEAYYYRGKAKMASNDSTGACQDIHKAILNGFKECEESLKRKCVK